jgi:hypothetical protein
MVHVDPAMSWPERKTSDSKPPNSKVTQSGPLTSKEEISNAKKRRWPLRGIVEEFNASNLAAASHDTALQDLLDVPNRFLPVKQSTSRQRTEKIGSESFFVVTATCGHDIHPSMPPYLNAECGSCSMTRALQEMRMYRKLMQKAGGATGPAARKPHEDMFANHSNFVKAEAEYESKRKAYNKALRGKKVGKGSATQGSEVKKYFKGGWRSRKAELATLVLKLEEDLELERKWIQEHSTLLSVKRVKESSGAGTALDIYKGTEPKLHFLPGDPAFLALPSQKRKRSDDAAPVYTSAIEIEEQPPSPAKKRRVTFNQNVAVSAPHIIEDTTSPASFWRRMRSSLEPRKAGILPLNRSASYKNASRSKNFYDRRSPLCTPGRWSSAPGKEKIDTSWYLLEWHEAEKDMRRHQTEGYYDAAVNDIATAAGWAWGLMTGRNLDWWAT